jgi:hypothetical protein
MTSRPSKSSLSSRHHPCSKKLDSEHEQPSSSLIHHLSVESRHRHISGALRHAEAIPISNITDGRGAGIACPGPGKE